MDNQLALRIEADWAARSERLRQRVTEAAGWLRDIQDVERHHSQGHSKGRLQASLGSFGSGVLDSGAMSEVLGRVAESHQTDPARSGRVTSLLARLDQTLAGWETEVGGVTNLALDGGAAPALAAATAVLDRMARLFGALRQAAMERHGRYREELHQAYFQQFTRQHLDSSELALCPPLLAAVPAEGRLAIGTVMELLGSGLPVKVLLLGAPSGAPGDGRLPGLEVELLPLTLQTVFVMQGASRREGFDELLGRALASPRAALVSLLWSRAADPLAQRREDQAVTAREFPLFVYDPDRSERFVERLQLGSNPDLDQAWARVELHHRDGNGQALVSEARMTVGEYYAGIPECDARFTVLEEEHRGRHLADWLGLESGERRRTVPFVYRVREDRLVRVVPDRELLAHCVRRAQVWETLRELSGVHNPHVEQAERLIEGRLQAERDEAIRVAREELAATLEVEKKAAVEQAMQNLARHLLGLGSGSLQALVPAPVRPVSGSSTPSAAAASGGASAGTAEPVAQAEGFWIDTPLCTACDECTTINPAIFAYNKNKQAVILDPKGGPYRDIVKAAEKCSAKIIHPGDPHDPAEKGLDKLIERAARFR